MRVLHVQRVKGIGGSERHLLALFPALERVGSTCGCACSRSATASGSSTRSGARASSTRSSGAGTSPTRAGPPAGGRDPAVPSPPRAHPSRPCRCLRSARRACGPVTGLSSVHGTPSSTGASRTSPPGRWRDGSRRDASRSPCTSPRCSNHRAGGARSDPGRPLRDRPRTLRAGRRRPDRGAPGAALVDDAIVVGIAWGLIPGKGHDSLVQAPSGRGRVPELKLLIVGDGTERARIEEFAAHAGHRGRWSCWDSFTTSRRSTPCATSSRSRRDRSSARDSGWRHSRRWRRASPSSRGRPGRCPKSSRTGDRRPRPALVDGALATRWSTSHATGPGAWRSQRRPARAHRSSASTDGGEDGRRLRGVDVSERREPGIPASSERGPERPGGEAAKSGSGARWEPGIRERRGRGRGEGKCERGRERVSRERRGRRAGGKRQERKDEPARSASASCASSTGSTSAAPRCRPPCSPRSRSRTASTTGSLGGTIDPRRGRLRGRSAPPTSGSSASHGLGRAPRPARRRPCPRPASCRRSAVPPHIVHTHKAKAGALGRLAAVDTSGAGHRPHVPRAPAPRVLLALEDAAVVAVERGLARPTTALVAVGAAVRDELLEAGIGGAASTRLYPRSRPRGPPDPAPRAELSGSRPVPVVTSSAGSRRSSAPNGSSTSRSRSHGRHPDAVFAIAGDGELPTRSDAQARPPRGRMVFLGWRGDVETRLRARATSSCSHRTTRGCRCR